MPTPFDPPNIHWMICKEGNDEILVARHEDRSPDGHWARARLTEYWQIENAADGVFECGEVTRDEATRFADKHPKAGGYAVLSVERRLRTMLS